MNRFSTKKGESEKFLISSRSVMSGVKPQKQNDKSGHFAKAIVRQNAKKWLTLGLKLKVPKHTKIYPQIHQSCCMPKTVQTITSFEKWSFQKGYSKGKWSKMDYLGVTLIVPRVSKKALYTHIIIVLCKKTTRNTLYIRKMTRF